MHADFERILYITSLTTKDVVPAGSPLFNANVFGTACTEVELDVLTGTYIIQRMDIIYDCGTRYGVVLSMSQVEYGETIYGKASLS